MQTTLDRWIVRGSAKKKHPAIHSQTPKEMQVDCRQIQQMAKCPDTGRWKSLKRCAPAKVDSSSRKTAKLSQDAIATENRVSQQIQDDEKLAEELNEQYVQEHADYEKARQEASILQQEAMLKYPPGKAYRLVELLTKTIQQILHKTKSAFDIEIVALDDMYFLAEKLITKQKKFQDEKKSFDLAVGYHYTSEHNVKRIRTDGLLNRSERDQHGIKDSGFNGAKYGEGIYTGDDPISFCNFGTVGLLVARLPGTAMEAEDAKNGYTMGNDSISSKRMNLLVLKESCQCLAAVKFATTIMSCKEGERLIALIHLSVQKLIDCVCTPRQAKMPAAVKIGDEIEVSDAEIDSLLKTWPKPLYGVPTAGISGQAVPQTAGISAQALPQTTGTGISGQTPVLQTAGTGTGQMVAPTSLAPVVQLSTRKQKERFLLLTRVLMKYLEQKDAQLHVEVRNTIRDCASRNSQKESGYESVTVAMLYRRLKAIVNEQYWKRAEVYLEHFLKQKEQTSTPRGTESSGERKACFRFVRSKQNIQMDVEMRIPATGLDIYNAGVQQANQWASGMFLVGNQDEIKSSKDKTSKVMIQVNSDGPKFAKSEFLSLKSHFFEPLVPVKKIPPVVQLILTIEQIKSTPEAEANFP